MTWHYLYDWTRLDCSCATVVYVLRNSCEMNWIHGVLELRNQHSRNRGQGIKVRWQWQFYILCLFVQPHSTVQYGTGQSSLKGISQMGCLQLIIRTYVIPYRTYMIEFCGKMNNILLAINNEYVCFPYFHFMMDYFICNNELIITIGSVCLSLKSCSHNLILESSP